jgi:Flp pilus assembly protein TadB
MNAEPSGEIQAADTRSGRPPVDAARRQARRREAHRRRHLARVDLGLGLAAAVVLLLAAPGLAISALIALTVLALCLLTFVLERRRSAERRREQR